MHIMAAMPHVDPLDVDDVLRRIEESIRVHAWLDGHGAPRHDGGRALSAAERAREIGTRLSRNSREHTR